MLKQFKNNIISIIQGIKSRTGSEILLMTSSALDEDNFSIVEPYYNAMEEAGKSENIPVAMVHKYWMESISKGTELKSLVQSDGVHPTENGYMLIAEALIKYL